MANESSGSGAVPRLPLAIKTISYEKLSYEQ